jgi:dihydroneopterin aldolase
LVGMDQIELEGMVFSGRHGVRPAEREERQEFKVDVRVDADLAAPGRSDKVEDTVDYRRLYGIAKAVIEGDSANLIETLAERIAERVLELDRVVTVSVRVAKRPQSMRPIDAASVEIRRTRA